MTDGIFIFLIPSHESTTRGMNSATGCPQVFVLFHQINKSRVKNGFQKKKYIGTYLFITPARTLSISGIKSRVLKLSFLSLNMMVKSGLEFVLKFTEPLQRYLLSCQTNSAILGRYFCTGLGEFQNKKPILLFSIIFM